MFGMNRRSVVRLSRSAWARLRAYLQPLLSISKVRRSRYTFCYLVLLPILIMYAFIRVIPIARSFVLSLYDWNLIQPIKLFIGLENYRALLKDELFLLSLKNTSMFAVFVVLGSTVLALALAVILAGKISFSPVYQAIFFLPVITPMVPMAVAWKWIYDPMYGILNYVLSLFGIPRVGWLVYPETALWAVIAMSVWKVIGYSMVIFLVGIKNIPSDYYEAAAIDGANSWNLFWRITLPLLKPILLYVLVTSMINAFNVFTQVYVMTTGSQAAPGRTLRVLIFDIYQNGFHYFRMGYASAEAVILTFLVLGLTLIQFRLMRTEY